MSELASRSGVPATTLRYYEQQGLLPARRSRGGYRLYDDAAVDRLAFISTAKGLGLPLPEIRRLLEPWEHGVCAQVQRALDPLLAQRLVEARSRIGDLVGFVRRLEQARAQLAAIERDGPCDPACTFLGDHPSAPILDQASTPVATSDPAAQLATGPVSPADQGTGHVPVACTLDSEGQRDRVDQWRRVLGSVSAREAIDGGVRLRLDPDRVDLGELVELAAAEAQCCAFLDLALRFGDPPVLEVSSAAGVEASPQVQALVEDMFGTPVPGGSR